jgi:hypothetical protein
MFQALVYARLAAIPEASDFTKSAKGVLFFGTPHYGSDWSRVHSSYLTLRSYFAPAATMIAELLSKNSKYLQNLQAEFALFRETLKATYFYEELAIGTGLGQILVTEPSAESRADLRLDHRLFSGSRRCPITTSTLSSFTRITSI